MNQSQQQSIGEVSAAERTQLLRLAYRFCWNPSDAEDALQNALLSAANHAEQLRDRDSRWGWLRRIVIQQCHLLGRKETRSAGLMRSIARESRASTTIDAVAKTRLDRKELGELMQRLLVNLPEKQRIAVTLRHLEHMDYSRIAEIMAVGESTVRTHVRAGREALRKMIQARHPEWCE